MAKNKNNSKQNALKLEIAGKPVTLYFASEPNTTAAEYIKKTLVNTYQLKAV